MGMIEIKDTLVSTEIFDKQFVCDLERCKGACCIEGDDGAPLTEEEISTIEDLLPEIMPYMTHEGIEVVNREGVFYMDRFNEPVTTLKKDKACVFVTEENGMYKCAIEKAYEDDGIAIKKPISCHLYPIRLKKIHDLTALNYDVWKICDDACKLGESLNVEVFKFLREPLIRKFGKDYYEELDKTYQEYIKFKNEKLD